MSRAEELTASIEAWRTRWETNPEVSFAHVAEHVGLIPSMVRSYANAAGWCRSPAVHAEMLRIASKRGIAARWAGHTPARQRPAIRPPAAPASVWDYGSGLATVTRRGQHQRIEVSA